MFETSDDFGECRVFLRIASVGTWLFVFLWFGMVAYGLSLLMVRRMSPNELRDEVGAMLPVLWGIGGGMALSLFIHLLGQIGCCASTPAPYGKPAVCSMISFGIAIVGGFSYVCSVGLGLFVVSVVVLATSIAIAYYSWMKYLHGLAARFGDNGLAIQINACLGVTLAAIALPVALGLLVAFYFPQLASLPWDIVFGLTFFVLSLWYAIVLANVASRVGKSLGLSG